MKKYKALFLLNVLCFSSVSLNGMKKAPQGPMNADWFYSQENPFSLANECHQNQEWDYAVKAYEMNLSLNITESNAVACKNHLQKMISESTPRTDNENPVSLEFIKPILSYDKNMALLNRAACLMAQRQASKSWAALDALLNIPQSRHISNSTMWCAGGDEDLNNTILVRTNLIGIGDIIHFFSAASILKNITGSYVIVSVPNFLLKTLADAAKEYNLELVGAQDKQPVPDYETHLISLLGHLKLTPSQMNPEKVVFTAPERAINAVLEQINPVLSQGNNLAVVFIGEKRQATLIGGRQLPHDINNHGRHLDSKPFAQLLRNHPNLTLMDCGNKNSRITVDKDQKNRYMIIPNEVQAFDTIIALARIMSTKKGIVGFGADNGPTNVFARSLDHDAQNRMALIIPNAKEHDMRMSGEGSVYKQMISNCWVYKCEKPSDQTQVVEQAYHHMLTY